MRSAHCLNMITISEMVVFIMGLMVVSFLDSLTSCIMDCWGILSVFFWDNKIYIFHKQCKILGELDLSTNEQITISNTMETTMKWVKH